MKQLRGIALRASFLVNVLAWFGFSSNHLVFSRGGKSMKIPIPGLRAASPPCEPSGRMACTNLCLERLFADVPCSFLFWGSEPRGFSWCLLFWDSMHDESAFRFFVVQIGCPPIFDSSLGFSASFQAATCTTSPKPPTVACLPEHYVSAHSGPHGWPPQPW